MNKKNLITIVTVSLSFFMLFSSLIPVTAVVFPYSVSTGDKIPYNVKILKNGTFTDWVIVKGLNLSTGNNFEMEIFDQPANPTNQYGTDFQVRFVKGDDEGDPFYAHMLLFSSNTTYWKDSGTNKTFDVGGTIYSYLFEGDIATYSWTEDADNIVKVKFNINDGIMTFFERKTTKFLAYGYTHLKYEKGSGSSIPSFELPISIIGMFIVIAVIRNRKKT